MCAISHEGVKRVRFLVQQTRPFHYGSFSSLSVSQSRGDACMTYGRTVSSKLAGCFNQDKTLVNLLEGRKIFNDCTISYVHTLPTTKGILGIKRALNPLRLPTREAPLSKTTLKPTRLSIWGRHIFLKDFSRNPKRRVPRSHACRPRGGPSF